MVAFYDWLKVIFGLTKGPFQDLRLMFWSVLWFKRDLPVNPLRTVKPLAKDRSTAKCCDFPSPVLNAASEASAPAAPAAAVPSLGGVARQFLAQSQPQLPVAQARRET